MRITERLMYSLGVCLAIMYYLEIADSKSLIAVRQKVFNLAFLILMLVTTVWGCVLEGMRVSQWIFLIS